MHIDKLMPSITSIVIAVFLTYMGAWYLDAVRGNLALVLFCVCCVTGIYWLAERFYFLPARQAAAQKLLDDTATKAAHLAKQGITQTDSLNMQGAQAAILAQPWWLDWTAGLFPVIFFVFMFRSFVFEPFKIPSGSMIPTLLVGDLILVNKFTYGVRLPVLHTKITDGNAPKAGDVMVFRFPPDGKTDYIKRVVGVPGDTVAYLNKQLTINGKAVPKEDIPDFFDQDMMVYNKQFSENLNGHKHRLLNYDGLRPITPSVRFPNMENCNYSLDGVVCKVPAGHYFMMGDNRDNSEDSRYWGFVPDANIVGRATLVWMNLSHLSRIGTGVQ